MSKLEISSEIIEALQKLSWLVESDNPLQETLDTVVELSVATLPGCDSVGITLGERGNERTAAASDDYATAIDNIQYETNEGPCLDTLADKTVHRIPDLDSESQWPAFCGRAVEKGLRGVLSLPLVKSETPGALNLYSRKAGAFEGLTSSIGEVFATQVGIAVHNAETYMAARRLTDQLNEAIQSRDLIGQAKGILMEREGISDAEAFDMLRTISQNANVKLRDIAQRLVDEKKRAAD